MLANLWEKYKICSDSCFPDRITPPFSYRVFDISSLAYKEHGPVSLYAACDIFGIDVDETKAHDALYDAGLHYKVLCGLFDKEVK